MDHHDMANAHVLIPIKSLDPSQFILIRWGDVVPVCWKLWKDQRIAHVETITFLVRESPFRRYFIVEKGVDSQLAVSSRSRRI